MDIREAARISFIKEDMSKRVARALLRKAAPVLKDYAVGDLVCFKTDQSGWTTACRIIGFEGAKLVWVIHHGMPACVALDRLRPVNASEALAYQHLKDATRLNIAPGRRIGFIDATRPLHSIQEDPEMTCRKRRMTRRRSWKKHLSTREGKDWNHKLRRRNRIRR